MTYWMGRGRWGGAGMVLLLSPLALQPACTTEPVSVRPLVEQLGSKIFFDERLSVNGNQACAACHAPDVGWTGPNQTVNAHGGVYEGSIAGRFGNRKPPASAYATLSPRFTFDAQVGFMGGNFWDGRATGWKLGNPAADQAQGPFLNPVEQALPDAAAVVSRVCRSEYTDLFTLVFGEQACGDVATAYDDIAIAIQIFEDSAKVNQFSSKYDAFRAGKVRLDADEDHGRQLFEGKARCTGCHSIESVADRGAVFSDFSFDNLGIPKNPENPFYRMNDVLVGGAPINPEGAQWVDPGLAGFISQLAAHDEWRKQRYVSSAVAGMSSAELSALVDQNRGKHRVPTLRNVALRPSAKVLKAFGHNGYFKSLKSVVHFYNTRDVLPRCSGEVTAAEALAAGCWPAPEVADNVNHRELGDLGLTEQEEDAIVRFLGTLSDGWKN